jgi:hypothetical protein
MNWSVLDCGGQEIDHLEPGMVVPYWSNGSGRAVVERGVVAVPRPAAGAFGLRVAG